MNWKVISLGPEALLREIRKAYKSGDLYRASLLAAHLSIVLSNNIGERLCKY